MTAAMGIIEASRANQWLGVALVMGGGLVLLSAMRLWQYFTGPHPEVSRKAAHIAANLLSASFPLLFQAAWPVWLIGGICIAGFILFRVSRFFFNMLGAVIDSVQRESLGGILGMVGIVAVFTVFRRDPLVYAIPVLIVGLADSAAALVGVHLGRHKYRVGKHVKSLEGSGAFFAVALLCTAVPLAALGGAGLAASLLVGVAIAGFLGVVESFSVGGWDNLLITVLGCPALAALWGAETGLLIRAASAAAILFILVLAWHLSRGKYRGLGGYGKTAPTATGPGRGGRSRRRSPA